MIRTYLKGTARKPGRKTPYRVEIIEDDDFPFYGKGRWTVKIDGKEREVGRVSLYRDGGSMRFPLATPGEESLGSDGAQIYIDRKHGRDKPVPPRLILKGMMAWMDIEVTK